MRSAGPGQRRRRSASRTTLPVMKATFAGPGEAALRYGYHCSPWGVDAHPIVLPDERLLQVASHANNILNSNRSFSIPAPSPSASRR